MDVQIARMACRNFNLRVKISSVTSKWSGSIPICACGVILPSRCVASGFCTVVAALPVLVNVRGMFSSAAIQWSRVCVVRILQRFCGVRRLALRVSSVIFRASEAAFGRGVYQFCAVMHLLISRAPRQPSPDLFFCPRSGVLLHITAL